MRDQELLFRGGVFTVITLEGPVVGVGQLMVEQQLLVVTSVIAKLTLKSETNTFKAHLLQLQRTDWCMTLLYNRIKVFSADLLSSRL